MALYDAHCYGMRYTVESPDEQTARDFVAYTQGIGRDLCSCGMAYWGRRGIEMHSGTGHGEPSLEEVDGFYATEKKHRRYVMREARLVDQRRM